MNFNNEKHRKTKVANCYGNKTHGCKKIQKNNEEECIPLHLSS